MLVRGKQHVRGAMCTHARDKSAAIARVDDFEVIAHNDVVVQNRVDVIVLVVTPAAIKTHSA